MASIEKWHVVALGALLVAAMAVIGSVFFAQAQAHQEARQATDLAHSAMTGGTALALRCE